MERIVRRPKYYYSGFRQETIQCNVIQAAASWSIPRMKLLLDSVRESPIAVISCRRRLRHSLVSFGYIIRFILVWRRWWLNIVSDTSHRLFDHQLNGFTDRAG